MHPLPPPKVASSYYSLTIAPISRSLMEVIDTLPNEIDEQRAAAEAALQLQREAFERTAAWVKDQVTRAAQRSAEAAEWRVRSGIFGAEVRRELERAERNGRAPVLEGLGTPTNPPFPRFVVAEQRAAVACGCRDSEVTREGEGGSRHRWCLLETCVEKSASS